jgi:hypothetical protein
MLDELLRGRLREMCPICFRGSCKKPPNGSLEIVQVQPIGTVARKGIESYKRQFVGFLARAIISDRNVPMKILYLTGGAGQMYCGSCLRDNSLATELMSRGHRVTLLPVYTPTLTDEKNVSYEKVFFGGLVSTSSNIFPCFVTLQSGSIASGTLSRCLNSHPVVRSPRVQRCSVR